MTVSRRHLAAVGALAFGAAGLLRHSSALAETGDQAGVEKQVEALRAAILKQDKAALEALASDQLSYGHSDGRVQNKAEFVAGVMNRKMTVKTLTFPELKVSVSGDAAVARHIYLSESEQDGKPGTTKLGALQVWQKQNGGWKLLARQGFKLPA